MVIHGATLGQKLCQLNDVAADGIGSWAANKAQNAMRFGYLQRVCGRPRPIGPVWAIDGVGPLWNNHLYHGVRSPPPIPIPKIFPLRLGLRLQTRGGGLNTRKQFGLEEVVWHRIRTNSYPKEAV